VANGIGTIAFPAISCGIFGYPVPEATDVAISTLLDFTRTDTSIQKIVFACFSDDILVAYADRLRRAQL